MALEGFIVVKQKKFCSLLRLVPPISCVPHMIVVHRQKLTA